mmetsp:Transcript_39193/g.126765  ORF Transcript_39193/g.126765 Transcript_39193/m.126765 type:complete len:527 (+) Transcript_39193:2682-4262(+)
MEHLALVFDVLKVRVRLDLLDVAARLAREVGHPHLLELRAQRGAEGEHAVARAELEQSLRPHVEEAIDRRVDPVFDGRARPELARVRRDVGAPVGDHVLGGEPGQRVVVVGGLVDPVADGVVLVVRRADGVLLDVRVVVDRLPQLDLVRNARQPVARRLRIGAGGRHEVGHELLGAAVLADGDDCRVGHERVVVAQRCLHLGEVDARAEHLDHPVDAAEDLQLAVGPPHAEVAAQHHLARAALAQQPASRGGPVHLVPARVRVGGVGVGARARRLIAERGGVARVGRVGRGREHRRRRDHHAAVVLGRRRVVDKLGGVELGRIVVAFARQARAREADLSDDARGEDPLELHAVLDLLGAAERGLLLVTRPLALLGGRQLALGDAAQHDLAPVVVGVRVARLAAVDVGHAQRVRLGVASKEVGGDHRRQRELLKGLEDGALGESVAVDELVAAQEQRARQVGGHRLARADARQALPAVAEPAAAEDGAVEGGRALDPAERAAALVGLGGGAVDHGGDARAVEALLVA